MTLEKGREAGAPVPPEPARHPRGTHRTRRSRGTPRDPLLLAAMSAVLPGSGHLYAGRRRTGIALLTLVVVAVTSAALVVQLVPRHTLVSLTVRRDWLLGAMAAAAVGTLVMLVVVISAYRAGSPARLPRGRRALTRVLVGGLCLAVVAPAGLVVSYANTQRSLIGHVFADREEGPASLSGATGVAPPPDPWAGKDRLNVLLIGGDGKATRDGVRNDSVTVASVDTSTGRTVMFSLPRNMQYARFPPGTPAAQQYPDGYPEFFYGVYRYGRENPDLFPGASDPGAAAVSAAAGETLGLTIHYYVLVNIHGFREMVDALGGIRLRVEERLPIGGIAADGSPAPVYHFIEPGLRTLDGYEALWYARSRAYSSDYARMGRQRCVLGALARQADPISVLRNFRALAAATKRNISTSIPQGRLPDFVDLAGEVKDARISSLQFVPPLIDPAGPDIDAIRDEVDAAITASEAAEEAGGDASGAGQKGSGESGDSGGRGSGGTGDATPRSVEDACSYE